MQFQPGDAAGFGVFEGADEEIARADGGAAQQHLASLQLQGRDIAAQQGGGRDARGQLFQGTGQQGVLHVPAPVEQHVQGFVAVGLGAAVDQCPGQGRQVALFHVQAAHQAIAAGVEGDVAQRVARRDEVQRVEGQVVVGAFFLAHGQDDAGAMAGCVLQGVAQQLVIVRAGRDFGKQDVDGQRLGVAFGNAVDQRGNDGPRPRPAADLQHADVIDVHQYHLAAGQPGVGAECQVVEAQVQIVHR